MASGSRIAVEISGSSVDLQRATAVAADALKQLGGVLKTQTDTAVKLSDSTIRSNEAVARSYQMAASAASSSSRKAAVSYSSSAKDQVAASERVVAAQERQASAMEASARAQTRANDLAAASAQRAADRQVASAARVKTAFGDASSGLSRAGKTISLGLAGVAVASAVMATKFEANTTRLQTQAGATAKQLQQLRKGMLDMAAAVGYTPDQLATGMYHVVSSLNKVLPAAQRVSGELQVMKVAAQGAQVGHANLEDTTYALASAINALHLGARDATRTMGELNSIVGTGDMTMQDLVDAFKSGLVPGAREAGLSMQSLGAALAVMGDMGMRGSLAGTRLRMSIALLSAPSEAAAKVLQTLGMSAHEATSTSQAMADALAKAGLRTTSLSQDMRKPDGFMVALQDLNKHLRDSGLTASGAAAVMNKAFGGGRMGATITLLAQNTDRLGTSFRQIGRDAGQFGADWQKTSQTTAFQLKSMEAQAAALGTRIGTDLLPYVRAGVHDLSDFVTWLEKGGTAAHGLELAVGSLAAVAVGSFFVSQIKKATGLLMDFKSALSFVGGSRPSVAGAGATGRGVTLPGASGMVGMVSGARGFTAPGSLANPIIVAMEAGEYAGLSSMGAAGTVTTEQKVAQAETGAVEAAGGAASVTGGTAAAEAAASTGVLASIKGGISSALGGLMRGGLIAAGGVGASQLAGGLIGGSAGKTVGTVGTYASVGAGLGSLAGPEGTAIGAIGGAIVGGLKSLFSSKSFGDQVTSGLTRGLGGAQQKQLDQSVSSLLSQGHALETKRTIGPAPNAALQAQGIGPKITGPTAADLAKAKQDYIKAGQEVAQALQAGWNQYKFQSEPVMFQQFSENIKKLPHDAQMAALQSAVKFSQTLESQGRLNKGATQQFISDVENQFPQLVNYMGLQAGASTQAFTKALDFTQAQTNTKTAMAAIANDFSGVRLSMTQTQGDTITKAGAMVQSLQGLVQNGTAPMRRQAEADLTDLRSAFDRDFTAMASMTTSKMGDISAAVQSGSMTAANQAGKYWQQFDSTIKGAETAGLLTVQKGNQMIAGELAKALEALGVSSTDAKKLASQGFTVKQVAAGLSSAAAAGITPNQPYEVGGWVGAQGERGRDTVHAVLGRGEAVLKHQDQAIVNSALAATPYGSLSGVFAATSGQRHYMATGGYVDPIPGFSLGRTDMGVDANAAPGTPIGAIGDSKLVGVIPHWYLGQPLLDFQLMDGPDAGRFWYVAEQIAPVTEAIGAMFKAGQMVARYATSGTGIEIGWAANASGTTLAQGTSGYSEGQVTPAGSSFASFLGGLAQGKITGGGGGVGSITAPKVGGSGAIAAIAQGALNLAAAAANSKLAAAGPGMGGLGGVPTGVSGPVPQEIDQALTALGWNKIAIAGAIGNAAQESSLQPGISGGGAAGLWQWTPGSKLFDYASSAHMPWQSVAVQAALMNRTIGGPGAINASGSPAAAAAWLMNNFEHPLASAANLPHRIAAAASAYAQGYDTGGFTTDRVRRGPKPPKPPKNRNPAKGRQQVSALGNKDLQSLGRVGGQVSGIETDLAGLIAQYSSMSSRFGVTEQSPAFVNADGSINAAGIQQSMSDDQTLLGIARHIEGDYVTELPLVTQALAHWLGSKAKTQGSINTDQAKITANKKKINANKIREVSIRKALLDLSKPTKNTVQQIQDQIDKVRLGWEGKIIGGEKAKLQFDESSVPRELALEQAVINATRKKLSYSAVTEAGRLKQGVLSAESAEKAYGGKDHPVKQRLSKAVDAARASYSEFLLGQAPVKAALASSKAGAELQLRQYLLSEKPTQQQLSDAVSNDRLSQRSALLPLEGALLAAKVAQQKRAQRIKVERFHLHQELEHLTGEDTKLSTTDSGLSSTITNLKGVLTGAGGGVSTNATISALETVAGKLGTIQWGAGGRFAGINTSGQGAAYDEQTTIDQLQNALGTLGQESSTATTTADTSALAQLEQTLATQIAEGNALLAAQSSVLIGFLPELGATEIPHYDKGGPVIGDQLAQIHDGEYVVPRGGALISAGGSTGPTTVELHQHLHGNAGALMSLIDQRIQHPENINVVSRGIGRRTSQLLNRPGWGR